MFFASPTAMGPDKNCIVPYTIYLIAKKMPDMQ
jgi:hypothetical protein